HAAASRTAQTKKPIYAFGSSTPRELTYLEKLTKEQKAYDKRLETSGGSGSGRHSSTERSPGGTPSREIPKTSPARLAVPGGSAARSLSPQAPSGFTKRAGAPSTSPGNAMTRSVFGRLSSTGSQSSSSASATRRAPTKPTASVTPTTAAKKRNADSVSLPKSPTAMTQSLHIPRERPARSAALPRTPTSRNQAEKPKPAPRAAAVAAAAKKPPLPSVRAAASKKPAESAQPAKEEPKPVPKVIRPLKAQQAAAALPPQPAVEATLQPTVDAVPPQEGAQDQSQEEATPATVVPDPIVDVEASHEEVNRAEQTHEQVDEVNPIVATTTNEPQLLDFDAVAEPHLDLSADIAGLSLADELQQHPAAPTNIETPLANVLPEATDGQAPAGCVEQIVNVEPVAPMIVDVSPVQPILEINTSPSTENIQHDAPMVIVDKQLISSSEPASENLFPSAPGEQPKDNEPPPSAVLESPTTSPVHRNNGEEIRSNTPEDALGGGDSSSAKESDAENSQPRPKLTTGRSSKSQQERENRRAKLTEILQRTRADGGTGAADNMVPTLEGISGSDAAARALERAAQLLKQRTAKSPPLNGETLNGANGSHDTAPPVVPIFTTPLPSNGTGQKPTTLADELGDLFNHQAPLPGQVPMDVIEPTTTLHAQKHAQQKQQEASDSSASTTNGQPPEDPHINGHGAHPEPHLPPPEPTIS
ncbi:hypothetical protein AAVH_35918, partial [Aphelenchoides avenae]